MRLPVAVLALFPLMLPAQSLDDPPELRSVLEAAQAAPPEFAADALLRVAASPAIKSRKRKEDLIEEAFRLAAAAQEPVRQIYCGPPLSPPPRPFGRARAIQRFKLDRLSLQCRAVRAILGFDPAKAREMFTAIPRPTPRRAACEDPLADDISEYYDTLGAVLKKAPALDLELAVAGMTSPVQVAPVAKLLRDRDAKGGVFERLAALYAGALEHISGDDRSFSGTVAVVDAAVRRDLAGALREKGLASAAEVLMGSYRKYLVNHFTGPRCADTTFSREAEERATDAFAGTVPFTDEELEPSRIEAKADLGFTGKQRTAESREAFEDFVELLAGRDVRNRKSGRVGPQTETRKNTPEWQTKFTDYVSRLENSKAAAGEPEADFAQHRCLSLAALVSITPPGPLRNSVISKLVTALKNSPMQFESWMEWAVAAEQAGAAEPLLDEMERSAHPALVLLARLKRAGGLSAKDQEGR